MLCHYHLLVCLSCFVANCWSSTSEYLIIRHGRSRVRHSSEKDHIRWGLQVFDNFTLLDYDTVDDSNETSSTGELRSLVKKAGKGRLGVDQFSDNSNNSDTLTIQFSESEELDRMIDISDFDSISIESGGGSSGRQQASFNSWRNNRTLNLPFSVDSIQRFTPIMPTAQGQKLVPKGVPQKKKLIKKEIMENIRKTVDKGLEYLKSHKNLDEVKIELKPFRARTKGTKNGNERLAHSSNPDTLLRKVIPSHERSPPTEQKKNELKHVNGNRKDYTQVSSPFSVSFESALASDGDQLQSAESELQHSITYLKEKYWKNVKINNDYTFFRPLSTATLERKQILTVTTASPENNDYPNDSPLLANGGDHRYPFASSDTANEATSWTDQGEKKSGPINGKTDRGNNAEEKFNYELRKQSFDSLSTETFQNDGPDGPADDEVINILNDTPTMSFEPNEADAPSTIIFNGADLDAAPDSDPSNSDDPLNWVSDAADSPDDVGTSDNNGDEADMSEIFRMEDIDLSELDETSRNNRRNLMKGRDVVTKFLQIVESQHLLGSNCTAGTALNLGEGVVDRYAQDRFRVEAEIAVNRANMLTRIFKFSSSEVQASEHLLHASVLSMVEFDDDIFAAGNCFDWNQHSAKKGLFCPFAYRLPPPDQGASLAKDLAAEYHYLGNTSEWFFLARKNAEKVIARNEQYIKSFHIYTNNSVRQSDEILSVKYEDGRWSKPYYDCGGGNIWMLTYTVPFFGYENGTYFFKGTSGIDIDLRRVDIDQCPQKSSPSGAPQPLNIFAGTDKCKPRTTECVPIPGLGFRRGSYRCVCRKGYYFPDTSIEQKWFNGTTLEEEYEKLMQSEYSTYHDASSYQCLPCAEGCDSCLDASPCVAALNWTMRTGILVLACAVIGLLPPAAVFTFRYQQVKVVRAASPALLRVIALGAFCIYCTSIVMYPPPSLYTCTARVWLREIGFSLTYGALMLKTWRISVIFRVRSAKAVKITDAYLLKRLGLLCGFVGIALLVRTLVAPPVVIVGRTADNLKAFLCKTDWWDHTFTSMEVLFLAWGVRLCIMVRKAPSEFNESRFISMAIYNEFLLTCFLNVSMLFLQSPANPDLLYIIFFCHTQLTVTLLLGLIFGSKVYLVFRGGGKHQDDSTGLGIKPSGAKFISRSHGRTFANASSVTTSTAQLGANIANDSRLTDEEAIEEIKQLHIQLQHLYERIPQRGIAITTITCLIDICKNSSLKPPPPIGGVKAILAAPAQTSQTHADKSTNTITLPNGTYNNDGWTGSGVNQPDAKIMITDDFDHTNRSIDNSNFNLDILQLKCMCSEAEVEEEREPRCECHHSGGGLGHSCYNTVSSFKHSDCCDSGRAMLVKQNSELVLSSSGCCPGAGQHGSGSHPANTCSSKFSELSAKNFESCDNLLHQQQKQRQKQISSDIVDNHSSRRPNSSGQCLATTTSSLSVDEKNFRNLNQENFNKLYANHNNKIDSLKENFLMRTALTTALHNLENENRSRSHRLTAESMQFPPAAGGIQRISPTCPTKSTAITSNTMTAAAATVSSSSSSKVHNTSTISTPTPSCSSSAASVVTTTASSGGGGAAVTATGSIAATAASGSTNVADVSSSSTPTSSTVDANGTASQQSKKKKSPEKRLVIDLNDRSKYTEEVSV